MQKSYLKEMFIFALLFMVIMFTLIIVFYDFVPRVEGTQSSIEYTPDSITTATLQEIAATQFTSENNENNSQVLDWSYSITESDLKMFASRNSYKSGKTNPFEEYKEETIDENKNETTDNSGTSSNVNSSESSSSNTAGTFFEKPGNK